MTRAERAMWLLLAVVALILGAWLWYARPADAWPGDGGVLPRDTPCYSEGWAPGDRWGPGPDDFIPWRSVPCPVEEPVASFAVELQAEIEIDVPEVTLPPTDTE